MADIEGLPGVNPETPLSGSEGSEIDWHPTAKEILNQGFGLYQGSGPLLDGPRYGSRNMGGFIRGRRLPDPYGENRYKEAIGSQHGYIDNFFAGLVPPIPKRDEPEYVLIERSPFATEHNVPVLEKRRFHKPIQIDTMFPKVLDGSPLEGAWESWTIFFRPSRVADPRRGMGIIGLTMPSQISEEVGELLGKTDFKQWSGLCTALFPDLITTDPGVGGTGKILLPESQKGIIFVQGDGRGAILNRKVF